MANTQKVMTLEDTAKLIAKVHANATGGAKFEYDNAKGEYGHIHHKMTHQIVTALYDADQLQMPLYVFGKYYRAAALPDVKDTLTPVSDEGLEKKEKLLQLYTSQAHTIQGLSHMNPYEMWTQTRGGAADDTAA